MTVKALINKLMEYDENKEIIISGCYGSEGDIFNIKIIDKYIILESDICSG